MKIVILINLFICVTLLASVKPEGDSLVAPVKPKPSLNTELQYKECTIETYSGKVFNDVHFSDLKDSVMRVYNDSAKMIVSVADIRKITFKKHGFWKGALWGSLGTLTVCGVIIAFALKNTHGEGSFAIGGVFIVAPILSAAVGVLTGVVTEFLTNDDVYFFDRKNGPERSKKILYIFSKHAD